MEESEDYQEYSRTIRCTPFNWQHFIFHRVRHFNFINRFELYNSIICLAGNKSVILLDEPVLGCDAIMRVEFYEMLTESFQKHPRVIIVSTHIIKEVAKTIQTLIIISY